MTPLAKLTIAATAAFMLAGSIADPADAASRRRYCQQVAAQHADNKVAGNAVGGAIGGALLGAGIGAIVGGHHSVGRGAAIGAGVGAVGGVARGSDRWNKYYWKRFNKCMNN